MPKHLIWLSAILCAVVLAGCTQVDPNPVTFDRIIRGGQLYDGNLGPARRVDIGINGDRIAAIGDLSSASAADTIDATGLTVAPGFINMLSWATHSLLVDGRSQGDIRQGVTLEVFGEGNSMGPINDAMRERLIARQKDFRFDVDWTTLDEYLQSLVRRGVSTNVASFIGATSVRVHELGFEDRQASEAELERMKELVRQAMEDGALGLGSSLIYAPAFFASTEELIALASVVGEYNGLYISHMRSESNQLLEAMDELIQIAREADVAAEIYHLKMGGEDNWHKYDAAIAKIQSARGEGLTITADMYTYPAGSSGLSAYMPPWVQEGGYEAWAKRLQDPEIRKRLRREMSTKTNAWENLGLAAGPEGILLVGFRNSELRGYTGMTLAEVAEARGTSIEDTAMDLVIEDGSRVQVVYFHMSEENVAKAVALPWVSFGSDAASMATEGAFLNRSSHPRAYGNFARVLGKYVRDEQVLPMDLAIHKLSKLPAKNLKLTERGEIKVGNFADIVAFDAETIRDHATFSEPHQYSTGMIHVIVNGEPVLRNGTHTGATPGQVVRGPGWTGSPERLTVPLGSDP